jgi:hypothetical protein
MTHTQANFGALSFRIQKCVSARGRAETLLGRSRYRAGWKCSSPSTIKTGIVSSIFPKKEDLVGRGSKRDLLPGSGAEARRRRGSERDGLLATSTFSIFPSLPGASKNQISDFACSRRRLGRRQWRRIVDRSSTCTPNFHFRFSASTMRSPEPGRHEWARIERQSRAPSQPGSKISSGYLVGSRCATVLWSSYVSFASHTKQSGVIAKETWCES